MSDSVVQARPAGRSAASLTAIAVAAVQGIALVVNGLAVAFVVLRDGITGPSAIASPTGVVVEVLLYLIFGAALLLIGHGLRRGSGSVLTPFALAQVLGLTVVVPMAQGEGPWAVVGMTGTALCVAGLVAWGLLLRSGLAAGRGS